MACPTITRAVRSMMMLVYWFDERYIREGLGGGGSHTVKIPL
jgi:hypothetical protein